MSELHQANPTGRFSGLADLYARHRPDYPVAAIDLIVSRMNLDATTLLVDVGCGTGISTRPFAARGIPVVGIEPNDAMRQQAEAAGGSPTLRYQAGRGEATGLPGECAVGVLSAQAFHWFDASAALAEFHRLLKPEGHVALVWNERDETDTCTAEYGACVRLAPEAARVEGPRVQAGEALLHSAQFTDAKKIALPHQQMLDEEGLIGRAFSASYVPREPPLGDAIESRLREVYRRHQREGRVRLCYVTTVYLARRP